ncbi:MAG TPA: LPXTG cell wall anchor domain-containing protein [Burkholderiaceae bacterium]|nr:LPXTG cell wall anchor domain-containing protein [Burkholderiaceae bacterium]
MRHISAFFVAAAFAALSLSAWAHGGEDHGSVATPILPAAKVPRATAQTEEFELVAALQEKRLMLVLDRFATNEPVIDAQIEVESGASNLVATQVTPGVYSIPGDAFARPGKYPLAISVQAGESADLLTATLDVPSPAVAGIKQNKAWNQWAIWGGSGALLAVGAGFIARRRRKKNTVTEG